MKTAEEGLNMIARLRDFTTVAAEFVPFEAVTTQYNTIKYNHKSKSDSLLMSRVTSWVKRTRGK